jgi:N-acetyl sugar amidotransferase
VAASQFAPRKRAVIYCRRCVLPSTKPGLRIDHEGICSACRSVERKRSSIDWEARAYRLQALCDEIRGSNGNGYECIVPVSGGKDSTYQVYMMSKVYGLRTLAVNVMAHLQTVEGIENLNSMVTNLGVDLVKVGVRPSTLQKIRRHCLLKIGDPNYADHRVMFSAVARTASFYYAPLVVWGEDIGVEFGGTVASSSAQDGSAEDLINNDLFRAGPFDELIGDIVPGNELFFYQHPEKAELMRKRVRTIYLGFFHWWDGYRHYEIAKRTGFQPRRLGPLSGNILDYDNIDEKLCEIHIWLKFMKFGFWRPTDQCCYKIWNGYMSRDEAVELVHAVQYQFPEEYLNEFLEYHELTEAEFWVCAERWRNPEIWHKVGNQWRLKYELA